MSQTWVFGWSFSNIASVHLYSSICGVRWHDYKHFWEDSCSLWIVLNQSSYTLFFVLIIFIFKILITKDLKVIPDVLFIAFRFKWIKVSSVPLMHLLLPGLNGSDLSLRPCCSPALSMGEGEKGKCWVYPWSGAWLCKGASSSSLGVLQLHCLLYSKARSSEPFKGLTYYLI